MWKTFLFIFISVILTNITIYLFSGFIHYIIFDSLTLTSLHYSLIDIIGHGRYQNISDSILNFSKIFTILIFILYFYLFYRHAKKKLYMNHLSEIMEEIHHIAQGNFHHQIEVKYDNDLNHLVTDVNNIILQIQQVIADERHIEHTKNELITNVSHDLRTPLTSIIGYLDLIEQDRYRDEIELRHYTAIAHEKAQSLEHLIDELFEYTRMQDNRLILNKTPINIAEILGQLITQNHIFFKEAHVICREKIATNGMYVLGDGEKLARVFDNLITNAIHYGKDGKYIDISASEINGMIIITITNYGTPIPSIDLPHIFDRFYRAEKSRSKHTGGSGLGLAIAKSIVTHHDGTIEAQSNLESTSFIVKLEKIDPQHTYQKITE